MMADVHELYNSEEVDNLLAQVSDDVRLEKTVGRSRSWTQPESASATNIGSQARVASLRNGLSARSTSLSCRFSSRQGEIVRALEAREQNRSFGRHDISRALEAREKNRVSIQHSRPAVSSAAGGKESKGRATTSTRGEAPSGEVEQVRFEPPDRGNVVSSQACGVSVPQPHAHALQDTHTSFGAPAAAAAAPIAPAAPAAAAPKEQRKSNLKTSSLKVPATSTEDKNEAPKGRVLILTSGPLGQTGVPVAHTEGLSSGSGRLVHFQGLPEPSSGSEEVPIIVLADSDEQGISRGSREVQSAAVLPDSLTAKAGTDQSDGPQAVTSLDGKGAQSVVEFEQHKHSREVPPAKTPTANTEIVSEPPEGNHISTASGVAVSAPPQESKGFTTPAKEYFEDSEIVGADLEARLQHLKAKDQSILRTPSGRIVASLVPLSDQVKALRSGSTRVLVSHLTSSTSGPKMPTRIPAVTSSRLTSSVSTSRLKGKAPPSSSAGPVTRENSATAPQSSSDPSSSSCSCHCFPYIGNRRRRRPRNLEGSAGRSSFSHVSPPSGLQKLQTPVASNMSARAEEDIRIRGSPHDHGEEQAVIDSLLDEGRLETEVDDWEETATAMKENLYGSNIRKSFSLEQVTKELSKASLEEESLTRMAEKLVRLAKETASQDQQWADGEEHGSSNGDMSLHEERYSTTAVNGLNGLEGDAYKGNGDDLLASKRHSIKRTGKRPNSL